LVRISLRGRRGVADKELAAKLSSLGFNRSDSSKELSLWLVESETMDGKPHAYASFIFRKGGIEAAYSITPEMNRKMRRISMARLCLDVLALSKFSGDAGGLYSEIARTLDDATEFADTNYLLLKNRCELLSSENAKLAAKNKELLSAGEKNSRTLLEVEKMNSALRERVRALESMSDESLREELLDWLKAHNGEINAADFARLHSLTPGRVEEGLDMLMKRGDITRQK
jgi:hypothetical protein